MRILPTLRSAPQTSLADVLYYGDPVHNYLPHSLPLAGPLYKMVAVLTGKNTGRQFAWPLENREHYKEVCIFTLGKFAGYTVEVYRIPAYLTVHPYLY